MWFQTVNKKSWRRRVLLLNAFILISACSSLSSQFDCPAPTPLKRCQSLLEVDAEFDRKAAQRVSVPLEATAITALALSSRASAQAHIPLATAGRVQRIWLAPFVDEDHHYHAASIVYTIISIVYTIINTGTRAKP